jgi:hypothetical protein
MSTGVQPVIDTRILVSHDYTDAAVGAGHGRMGIEMDGEVTIVK